MFFTDHVLSYLPFLLYDLQKKKKKVRKVLWVQVDTARDLIFRKYRVSNLWKSSLSGVSSVSHPRVEESIHTHYAFFLILTYASSVFFQYA